MSDASQNSDLTAILERLNAQADTTWIGEGKDTFPTPNGPVVTPYRETMTIGAPFDTVNGDPNSSSSQKLLCIHYYTQLVNASTGVPMHQETGYWLLHHSDNTFAKAVAIPRGITILAGGTYEVSGTSLKMTGQATAGDSTYGISNEPYLEQNAKTQSFNTVISQTNNTLSYQETSVLRIMGQNFNHTDEAELTAQP